MTASLAEPGPPGLDDNPSKTRLLTLVQQLCDKYGWATGGRSRTQAILALLGDEACERYITFELANRVQRDTDKFDPAWSAKSETATIFILDDLKQRLQSEGFAAGLAREVRDAVGTYDVQVVRGRPSMVLRGGVPSSRIEVKASLGLGGSQGRSLGQVSRYLLNPLPLVISRVAVGTVVLLRPRELTSFVTRYADLLASKAERLLKESPYLVPGPGCRSCMDRACPFNERRSQGKGRLVAMGEEEFEADLVRFYSNLPRVSENTASLVIQLLKEGNGAPN